MSSLKIYVNKMKGDCVYDNKRREHIHIHMSELIVKRRLLLENRIIKIINECQLRYIHVAMVCQRTQYI